MERLKRRIEQLKFIASMFRMTMEELDNVMGPESIKTIFRLIGERQGEKVEARLKDKFKIDKWTPEVFAEKLISDVIEPAIGTDKCVIKRDENELTVHIKVCPFKKAGIDISNQFYCTYTQGLIETSAKAALGDISFSTDDLISTGEECCIFKIKMN
jgi:hypothetical protein